MTIEKLSKVDSGFQQSPGPATPDIAHRFDPSSLFPSLRIGIFRFTFVVISGAGSPTPSAWRGALGWALQRRCCGKTGGVSACSSCQRSDTCVYFFFYEHTTSLSGLKDPPRQYVLGTIPGHDGEIVLELKLFNHATELINTLAESLTAVAAAGIDANGSKVRGELCRIEQIVPGRGCAVLFHHGKPQFSPRLHWPLADYLVAPPPPEAIWEVWLHTPLRLRKEKSYLQQIDWPHAFHCLAGRLSALEVMNGGHRMEEEKWTALMDFFDLPGTWVNDTRWREWSRRSNRQDRFIPMGGVTGRLLLHPPDSQRRNWWHWWRAAELFNLGKGTTMGNGRITIRPSQQRERIAS